MAEREYLDYQDWLNAGGLEGTGQQSPGQGPQMMDAPTSLHWRRDPNNRPGRTYEEDGRVRNVADGSDWFWVDGEWKVQPTSVHTTTTPSGGAPTYDYGPGPGGGPTGGPNPFEPFTGTPPGWRPGPTFQPPTFVAPPPFAYDQFQAPTQDSIYQDPSYQFRLGEGQRALEQSAAGRGVLRTGGTLKDLVNYGQNAASQEYSNIFDRAVQGHNLGLTQALGTYTTNYGVGRDVYDRLYEGSKAQFEGLQRENVLQNQRDFDNFLADFDIFEKNRRRSGDYLFQGASAGGL